jgi:hypothetical protein
MQSTVLNGYAENSETYGEYTFGETPFMDARTHEQEDMGRELPAAETYLGNWEFSTPFVSGESGQAEASEITAPEIAAFSELAAELKDPLFREALEQLTDEALEAHADLFAGEYGDREARDLAAERTLLAHFAPLATQADAMLERFFERIGEYNAETLTDQEIERISSEVLPLAPGMSPASEQFFGALLRKAGKLVSGAAHVVRSAAAGAANLAAKGLAAVGKLALPFLAPLKKIARAVLHHVAKRALRLLPEKLRPLGQKLADKLFNALGDHEEAESGNQTEAEPAPAALDAARLEAEFDVQVAQLLLAPEEAELDHLISSYADTSAYSSGLSELDDTRAQLTKELSRLEPGESGQPVIEHFLPALWPAVKAASAIYGRGRIKSHMAGWISKAIEPHIGPEGARMLAPAIADAGLRLFGLEAGYPPQAMLAEALAATVEETVNAISELPAHVFQNETLLSEAVQEAFENAAASYFPNSAIRPDLLESAETHGMWARMPIRSERKRYAKYSHAIPVEISPRMARGIHTFGSATLHDHLRDHQGVPEGRPFKGRITLYQALPGTRGSTIARAERFPVSQLLPLTPHAAGALLGPGAALGMRPTPPAYLHSPQSLHVNQRVYRLEPLTGGRHHHVRGVHTEVSINLQRGEIRLWLYLSEPLCQRIAAELSKGANTAVAFRRLKRLLARATEAVAMAHVHKHLPPHLIVVSDTPNLDGRTPPWLRHAGHRLAGKIAEWAEAQLAQYLQNHAADFKRACESQHDGVTLRITMTRIPGMDALRLLSKGKIPKELSGDGWPQGAPEFHVVARGGHVIHRLRD